MIRTIIILALFVLIDKVYSQDIKDPSERPKYSIYKIYVAPT